MREREEREWDDYLSHSGKQTFEQCPKRWAYIYLDGRPEPTSDSAFFGNLVHDVMEMQFDPVRYPNALEIDIQSVWDENAEEIERRWPGERMAQKAKVLQCCRNGTRPGHPPAVVAVEKKLDVEIGGVRMKGYIDRVDRLRDGRVRLVDYKTGKVPSGRYLEQAFEQLYLYAYAYQVQEGQSVGEVQLFYLGGQGVTHTRLIGEQPTRAAMNFMYAWEDISHAVEVDGEGGEPFFERIGPLCGWCGFNDECIPGQVYLREHPKYAGKK